MSDPPTPNRTPWYKLPTSGATPMSALSYEFLCPSLPRTPANPVTSNQTNDHRPKKRPYGTFNLYQLSNDPDRRIFSDKLIMYHIERGTPIIKCPTINKQPLDLYEVYLAVKAKGGFAEVMKGEMWKEIADFIGIGAFSSAVDTLKCQYIKYLLPFECKYDRGCIDPDGALASSLPSISWGVNGQAPQNLNHIQTQPTAQTQSQRQLRPIFQNRRTQWHQSITQDLRDQMVIKILQGIWPTADSSTVHDTRMIDIVAYARNLEADMYGDANCREEYYQMIAENVYKIEKDLKEKRQNREKMRLQQVSPGLEPMIENSSGAPSPKADELPEPGFHYKVLQDLKNLLLSGECSDVIIQVEDQQFKAHRSILTARSSVFAAMFRHDMKEKASGIVNVEDCEPTSFPVFLEYLYCGSPEKLSSENVINLYASADKYDVQDLKMKCLEFMKKNLSVDTIYKTLQIALQHSDTDLLNFATEFFIRNLLLIIPTTKWETFLSENPIEGDRLFKKAEETYK